MKEQQDNMTIELMVFHVNPALQDSDLTADFSHEEDSIGEEEELLQQDTINKEYFPPSIHQPSMKALNITLHFFLRDFIMKLEAIFDSGASKPFVYFLDIPNSMLQSDHVQLNKHTQVWKTQQSNFQTRYMITAATKFP